MWWAESLCRRGGCCACWRRHAQQSPEGAVGCSHWDKVAHHDVAGHHIQPAFERHPAVWVRVLQSEYVVEGCNCEGVTAVCQKRHKVCEDGGVVHGKGKDRSVGQLPASSCTQ